MTSRIRHLVGGSILAITAAFVIAAPAGTSFAEDSLAVTTPYPTVEAQPGTTVKLDLSVADPMVEPVDLAVAGLDDGWSATIRGGGFVIHEITAEPDKGAKASLEIDVPPDAAAGEHGITVTATNDSGVRSIAKISIMVADQVDNGITLSADFPSLSGDPGGSFSYTLTIDNKTPIEQTFTFDPTGPQGWTVTASPSAEEKAQTLTVDAGATADLKVTASPPVSADEGIYPIDVAVVGANGAKGSITLQAEVVGTPKLSLGTADERLDVAGRADAEKRIPMIISNSGSGPLKAVKLAGTAPSDWDITFDPKQIDTVQPGETAQVTAIVTPSSDAVAGDYAMTVRASAGSLSSNVDLRYTINGSRRLGIISVGVIAAAFLALAGVFIKFGRR